MCESKTILSWDVGIINLAYCKIKFTHDNFEILNWDIINLRKSSPLCCHVNKNKLCKAKATHIDNINLYYCQKHTPKKSIKLSKPTIYDSTHELMRELDLIEPLLSDVDEILIENQPSFKNPIMKSMSIILYTTLYYKLRKNIIKFISPSKKLLVNKNKTKDVLEKIDKKKSYSTTKKLGIAYCYCLLSDSDKKYLNEKQNKKDDYADSFLQAFRYNYKVIPDKFMILLNGV